MQKKKLRRKLNKISVKINEKKKSKQAAKEFYNTHQFGKVHKIECKARLYQKGQNT